MYNNAPGGGFYFIPPQQSSYASRGRRGRRSHRPRETVDPFDFIIRQREELDELERYYKERSEKNKDNKGKDEKKPPTFEQQLGDYLKRVCICMVVGLPVGLVFLAGLKQFALATGIIIGVK